MLVAIQVARSGAIVSNDSSPSVSKEVSKTVTRAGVQLSLEVRYTLP